MLATLSDERELSDDWVLERKLDGVRCLAFVRDGAVVAALAQPAPARLPGHRARARAARRCDRRRRDRRGRPTTASRSASRRCSVTALRRCGRSTCSGRRRGPARPAAARAARGARGRPPARPGAPGQRARRRAERGGVCACVRGRLGGPDRQAQGRALPWRSLARLAQAQVRARAGGRHRRLHRAARLARRDRRAADRLLRAPARCATRARSAPASTPPPSWRCARGSSRSRRRRRPSTSRSSRCHRVRTGSARRSSPRSASPSGRPPGGCASRATSGCATTRLRAAVVRERPA